MSFFMLGPVHTYRFHLKTEILLSSLVYPCENAPGGLQVIKVVRKVEDEIIKYDFFVIFEPWNDIVASSTAKIFFTFDT